MSPRRRLLLPLLGCPVQCEASEVEESPLSGESPTQTALRLAEQKASAVAAPAPGEVVLGADTVVVLGGRQLGKPFDAAEAARMLRSLRGQSHLVITAVVLLGPTATHRVSCQTEVRLRDYSDREIDDYIASGRPLDKAGAYAIQDEDFGPVAAIDGCYLNVVGLPLCKVWRGLAGLGWNLGPECFRPPCRLCTLGKASLGGGR